MKTNLVKAAVVILGVVLTTSVNAQNTKSFKENRIANRISSFVKTSFSNSSNDLTEQLNNLKKFVIYTPAKEMDYKETGEANLVNLTELEPAVKFVPGVFDETAQYTAEDFEKELGELEQYARYNPSVENEVFENINNELASIIKYTPAQSL